MSELTAGTLDTQAIIDRAMKQPASTWGEVFRFAGAFLLNKPLPEAETTTPTHITQARAIVKETFETDQNREGPSMTTTVSTATPEDLAAETSTAPKAGFFVRMGQSVWKNKESIIIGGAVSYVARAALAAKFTAAAGSLFNPATAAVVGAVVLGGAIGGVTGIIRDRLSNDEKVIAARAHKYWYMQSFAKGAGFGLLGGAFGTVGIDMIREVATSEPVKLVFNTVADAWKDHAAPVLTAALTTAKAFAFEKVEAIAEFKTTAQETLKGAMIKTRDFCTALPEKIVPAAKETMNAISAKMGSFFSTVGKMLTLSKPQVDLPTPETLVSSTVQDTSATTIGTAAETAATLPPIDGEGVQKVLREITPPEPTPEAVIAETPVAPTLPEVPAKFKELFTPEAYAHITGDEKMATWLKLATSDNAAKSLRAMKEITVCLMNSSDETVRTSAAQVINVMYGRAVDTGMTETPIGNEIERLISYAYAKGTFGLEKSELAATVMAKLAEPNGDRFTKSLLAAAEAKRPNVFEKAMKLAADTRQYILPRGPIIQNG